jgi:hypothetical protein
MCRPGDLGMPGMSAPSTLRAMANTLTALFLGALGWAIALAFLYLVIRFAVRHAIEDADRRRSAERPRTW